MKIDPADLDPDTLPTPRPFFYLRDTRWGVVAQARPSYRKPKPGDARWWWQKQFGLAARMAADPIWQDYGTALEMVKGTTMVPRDFLMQCIYGNAYIITETDGQEWVPTPKTLPETPQEEDMRQWTWAVMGTPYSGSLSSAGYAWKGNSFLPAISAPVTGASAIFNAVAAGTYQMAICDLDNTNTVTAVTLSTPQTGLTGLKSFAFEIAYDMQAGKRIGLLVGRTDQTGTFPLPISYHSSAGFLWPNEPLNAVRLAKTTISIGDTLDAPAPQANPLGLLLDLVSGL